ncbi:MAG: hypothetical protein DCF29_10510 [Alphaproteobacteria bacterium]|nr:MAG: hypothetical protein DCF29_10510 [Alphaproteobacteria bacterium]
MLTEPQTDAALTALDRAVAEAVRDRLSAPVQAHPDAQAITLRQTLAGLTAAQSAAVRAVLGRIDAAQGLPLVVWGSSAQVLAADRHGLSARVATDPEQALTAVRSGSRALMDLTTAKAWWGRLLAEPSLRIVGALPDDRHGTPRALMVQQTPPGPTGDDRTFWVTDSAAPDARIVETLSNSGLAATPLIASRGLKLFTLAGYVQAEDVRLIDAPGILHGVIGAAPLF